MSILSLNANWIHNWALFSIHIRMRAIWNGWYAATFVFHLTTKPRFSNYQLLFPVVSVWLYCLNHISTIDRIVTVTSNRGRWTRSFFASLPTVYRWMFHTWFDTKINRHFILYIRLWFTCFIKVAHYCNEHRTYSVDFHSTAMFAQMCVYVNLWVRRCCCFLR